MKKRSILNCLRRDTWEVEVLKPLDVKQLEVLGWGAIVKQILNFDTKVIIMMQKMLSRKLVLSALTLMFAGSVSSLTEMSAYAQVTPSNKKILLAQKQRFPMRGSRFTELRDHRRMETNITISNNGRIDGVTRVWTAKRCCGFTGALAVALTDRAGNILYVTKSRSWGVDGKAIIGKPSDRTVKWDDQVPSKVLSKVGGYAIFHSTDSKDRLMDWLKTAKEAATEVKSIYSKF